MTQEVVPVLYSIDLAHEKYQIVDAFTLFLSSLASVCKNSSKALDVAIVCRGWESRHHDAVRLVMSYAPSGSRVSFVDNIDEKYDDLRRVKSSIDSHGWPKCIMDRLAIRSIFTGYGWAFFLDMDVLFSDDIFNSMKDAEDDVAFYAVPDGYITQVKGKDREEEVSKHRGIPRFSAGCVLCNMSLFPTLKQCVDYYFDNKADMDSNCFTMEQDIMSYYAWDKGLKTACFDSTTHTLPFLYWESVPDSDVEYCYSRFGVKGARKPTFNGIKCLHMAGKGKERGFYDPDSDEYRFSKEYRRIADRAIDATTLSYPMVLKKFARATDVVRRTSPNRPFSDEPHRRTVVYSNSGSERWRDFLTPSVLSLSSHSSVDLRIVVLENAGNASSPYDKDLLRKAAGERNYVEYREVDLDLGIFSDNRWTGVNLHKLFMHSILGDIDDYCLFMDSDVMVIDDIGPLFSVCDAQPTKDKFLGTLNWFHFTDRHPIPVQPAGGFFFMHPNGYPARAAYKRMFTSEWHDNDEYVIGDCVDPSDFVNLDNASIEAITEGGANGQERRDRLAKAGIPEGRVFAVHFLSSSVSDRFNRLRMRKDFRRYVDDWNVYRRLAGFVYGREPS
jgi:lipopolysaccharide biosynthesis glycosyltransferase